MDNCCIYNFGKFGHNADVVLSDLIAPNDGNYIVEVQLPNGAVNNITLALNADDEITIPKGKLNEDAFIKFQVYNISEKEYLFMFIPNTYDSCENFALTTYINLNSECYAACSNNDNPQGPYE
jgi:hypothetical protein